MKLILEFDDLNPHPEVNCILVIDQLIQRYPNIILNFFTIPNYLGTSPLYNDKEWCKKIRKYIDSGNINLCVHGCYHTQEEFKHLNYVDAHKCLLYGLNVFKYSGLPVARVFRGPHWGINHETFMALRALNFTHVYSHISYAALNQSWEDEIKVVYYNWNLKDNFGIFENPPNDVIVAHGHTPDVCGNGIGQSHNRICNALDSNSFEFLRVQDI